MGFVVLSPNWKSLLECATPTDPEQNYANVEQTVRARKLELTAPVRHGENSTRQRIEKMVLNTLEKPEFQEQMERIIANRRQ